MSIIVVIYFVQLFGPWFTGAQFPTLCTTSEVLQSRECCPVPEGYSEPCGGSGRGRCDFIPPSNESDYQPHFSWLTDEERAEWPSVFFDQGCVCEYPFYGFDCSQCVFGLYGDECTEKRTLVRTNVETDEAARHKFLLYAQWMKGNVSEYSVMPINFSDMFDTDGLISSKFLQVSRYDFFIWSHHYACKEYIVDGNEFPYFGFAHQSAAFSPWHRTFLMLYERDVQRLTGDEDFTVPYWKWIGMEGCPICTAEMFGYGDEYGYLTDSVWTKDFEVVCCFCGNSDTCDPTDKRGGLYREYNPDVSLPTTTQLSMLMNMRDYDTAPYNGLSNCSFRNILGGTGDADTGYHNVVRGDPFMHGAVHFSLGGIMISVPCSPNDPIFWPLHSYTDMLFEMWYRFNNATIDFYPESGAAYGHNRYAYQVPLFPVRMNNESFINSVELGYTFDDIDDRGRTSDWDSFYDESTIAECYDYI